MLQGIFHEQTYFMDFSIQNHLKKRETTAQNVDPWV